MQKAKYNRMIIEIHDSLRSRKKVFEFFENMLEPPDSLSIEMKDS